MSASRQELVTKDTRSNTEAVMQIAFRLRCRNEQQRKRLFPVYISVGCTQRHPHMYSTQKYPTLISTHAHTPGLSHSSIGGLTKVVYCA